MLSRRTSALHAHRWSQPASVYFVTCCTRFRATNLTSVPVTGVIHGVVSALDTNEDAITHAFTVMPDHVHWLFTLGNRLSLGRVIACLKAQTKDALSGEGLTWQRDFFEHRLSEEETIEPYGLYVFLNPYRAALLPAQVAWPHWWCPRPEDFEFLARLNHDGTPPAEWIGESPPNGLAVGE
ncbi:MAG: transposase [Opitutaceae bacterium]|nr:transposase [Opitutaceae bacterium]